MSEKMYPIPFASLMNWVVTEYAQSGDIFGVHKKYEASGVFHKHHLRTAAELVRKFIGYLIKPLCIILKRHYCFCARFT